MQSSSAGNGGTAAWVRWVLGVLAFLVMWWAGATGAERRTMREDISELEKAVAGMEASLVYIVATVGEIKEKLE